MLVGVERRIDFVERPEVVCASYGTRVAECVDCQFGSWREFRLYWVVIVG